MGLSQTNNEKKIEIHNQQHFWQFSARLHYVALAEKWKIILLNIPLWELYEFQSWHLSPIYK